MEFTEAQAMWLLSLCGPGLSTTLTVGEGAQIVVVDPNDWEKLLQGRRLRDVVEVSPPGTTGLQA